MALRKKGTPDEDTPRTPAIYPAVSEEIVRILSILPSASLVVAPDGVVLRASSRALTLGIVNRSVVAVPDIVDIVGKVADDGSPREQTLRVRRPPLGRELLEVRVRVAPLSSGAILVLIDDLAEERRVDAVRRDFVANVSHELKTPVGALSILAEAVLSSADDPEQVQHFAEKMQTEAKRIGSLIQDVIDLSRLQSDDPMNRAELVDTDQLINRAIEEVRTIATGLDIEIIRGEEIDAPLLGDRGQLLTALRNLLTNAISYSAANTRVSVTAREVDGIVEISVKDAGIGIPPHDLDRIFERFYRVDPARSRGTGGTGLGLAIVKHVCQNHGGECTVWSEVGTGSTFTLRIPAYNPMLEQSREAQEFTVDTLSVVKGRSL
ncbi:MAG: sensor histidine kinase [Candidatus Nanopelagicales bacterium]|nr:sensor histidine kinase [Candidatus Nanopelagicales bacterium]MCF8539050.1 sensor histidine kinase [Candidatus Nanopelagicales bacterium]MCF8550521.1 sensor histidine kinase [Candidatus Nanopelagicales bacterium]